MYFFVFFSVLHPNGPWRAAEFGPSPYTVNDIRAVPEFGTTLATNLFAATYGYGTNSIVLALSIMIATVFGLRRRQKWAWYTLLGLYLWGGGNDAVGAIISNIPPIPLIPLTLGITGLLFARSSIFGASPSNLTS